MVAIETLNTRLQNFPLTNDAIRQIDSFLHLIHTLLKQTCRCLSTQTTIDISIINLATQTVFGDGMYQNINKVVDDVVDEKYTLLFTANDFPLSSSTESARMYTLATLEYVCADLLHLYQAYCRQLGRFMITAECIAGLLEDQEFSVLFRRFRIHILGLPIPLCRRTLRTKQQIQKLQAKAGTLLPNTAFTEVVKYYLPEDTKMTKQGITYLQLYIEHVIVQKLRDLNRVKLYKKDLVKLLNDA